MRRYWKKRDVRIFYVHLKDWNWSQNTTCVWSLLLLVAVYFFELKLVMLVIKSVKLMHTKWRCFITSDICFCKSYRYSISKSRILYYFPLNFKYCIYHSNPLPFCFISSRFDFEKFVAALSDVIHGLEERLQQWSEYEGSFDRLLVWLSESETALKNYAPRSTLEEKQEQLEKYKVYSNKKIIVTVLSVK